MDENEVREALEVLTGVPASVTVLIIKVMPWKELGSYAWKWLKALFTKEKKPDPITLPPVPTIVNYGTVNYYSQPPQ